MNGDFPSHWQLKSLNESMDAIIDCRGKTPTKSTSGIPLITAKIVKGDRLEKPSEFIAEELYDGWMTSNFHFGIFYSNCRPRSA